MIYSLVSHQSEWLGLAQKLLKCFPFAKRKHVAVAFCLQNVQSLRDFCGQIMPSYSCTIPYRCDIWI